MELASDFEQNARQELAEDVHRKTVDEPDNLAFRFLQQIRSNFERYASRNGYDLDETLDTLRVTDVERRSDGISVTIEGDHPIGLFESGAPPHRIEGDPLHWVDPETGEDVFVTHVDHPGLPEGRGFRDAMHWLRREVQS